MRLRINNKDPFLIEDEMCNPMFRYLGIHLSDVDYFVNKIEELEEKIRDLEYDIRELEHDLWDLE